MKNIVKVSITVLCLNLLSCNYFTYIPRTKRKQQHEKPSALLLDRMVDYRLEQNAWPPSMQEFMSKGKKYYEVVSNFPYRTTSFNIIDSNNMTFYFNDHINDIKRYERTQKIDLNSYGGRVKFWKADGRFLWKIRML